MERREGSDELDEGGYEFRFPSNGKASPEDVMDMRQRYADGFRFPSNGKAHGKIARIKSLKSRPEVSIPFKREGTWKDTWDWTGAGYYI